jgi:opacity protein-like surface antigen
MKKLIIVIAITLMAAASANAQFYKGFGIKAGTSIANHTFTYNGEAFDFPKYKFGFNAGIFKEFQIIQNLKAQVGINYARKGSNWDIQTTNAYGDLTEIRTEPLHIDFITTELYAKYEILNGRIKPYALAGLRVDFFLSQKQTSTFQGVEYELSGINPTNNKIFGATLGAGLEYQVSKLYSVFIEGTYNPDIIYITNEMDDYSNEQKIRGRSFDIRTGIKF